MTHEEALQRHIELCRRVYARMEREGSWPWADSQKSEDLIESEDNPNET